MTRRFVGGAGAAPCDTLTVRPAIVRVVFRAVVVDVAENEIVALPVPDAAPETTAAGQWTLTASFQIVECRPAGNGSVSCLSEKPGHEVGNGALPAERDQDMASRSTASISASSMPRGPLGDVFEYPSRLDEQNRQD